MVTVEYSSTQKCFHVDDLEKVLSLNMTNALHRQTNDYQIIGIFQDDQAADKFIAEFKRRQASACGIMPL